MPKRQLSKLTPKTKEKIKKNFKELRLSDFKGEALAYLRKVRGAAKARKDKKGKQAKVSAVAIPKDSEAYRIIEAAAKKNKMSVAAFIKKHKDSIDKLLKDGDVVLNRETEYLIRDINKLPAGKKIFVNDGNGYFKRSKGKAILYLQLLLQLVHSTDIFLLIFRVHYKLNGDLTFYCPDPDSYEGMEGDEEEVESLLDEYYPEITYLKSRKSNVEPKKEKRIGTDAERKKAANHVRKEKAKAKASGKGKKKNTNKPKHKGKR
jgi:hypothetical protein